MFGLVFGVLFRCSVFGVLLRRNVLVETGLKKTRNSRRWWMTELYRRREDNALVRDLQFQHVSGQYKNFVRMSPTCFEFLLGKIGPKITRQETHFRTPISVQDRLALTLRFLASGDSYTSLQYLFRISKQSIGRIVPEVCEALIAELQDNIKLPRNPDGWLSISNAFEEMWNLPHCVGAIDGKHVVLQSPLHSGSEYFNYKSTFSIVLMATVDAECRFIFVGAGCQGRISDGGVFRDTAMFRSIVENSLGLPPPTELPGRRVKLPYFFAADSAFPLMENIVKPYPGTHAIGSPKRILNYRLSRARRVVKNAFGIVSSVFRVLRKPMLLQPETAQKIVMAIVHLHNFLKDHSAHEYAPHGYIDREEDGRVIEGTWRNDQGDISSLTPVRNVPRRPSHHAEAVRLELSDYCVKEGAVPWQSRSQ